MNNMKRFAALLVTSLALASMPSCTTEKLEKKTVGATEMISVAEAQLTFNARIDTGARATSIHVTQIHIENATEDKKQNVGKKVEIVVENEKGESSRIRTKIVKVAEVRNTQGVELRYLVPLTLQWNGDTKTINVNLRDRSTMTYKLLIGRDWLLNDYVVDVSVAR